MQDIHEARLLLVDDEPEVLTMLDTLLRQEGFDQIRTVLTAADALTVAQDFAPQAVLLDVMLPDGDGFGLFSQLRRQADIPVLFLSARDEDEARLRGLGLGADDYITKPFLPRELTLRLLAVLRRTYMTTEPSSPERILLGGVTVDMSSGTVTGNGEEKILTAKEYALLSKLNENRGHIVTMDNLCLAVWNDENIGYDNTLMVHMRRLREKIEADPSHPRWLITMRGLGYRLLKEAKAP
ncbi:MAG TPA: response regulator transcription factor [Anaerovoracaceae bacterium]|nr:response regulator transcription factor [Anaerovoracaceae bacterium]